MSRTAEFVDYATLSQPEQTACCEASKIFPVTTVGKEALSGGMVLTARIFGTGKEVYRIPYTPEIVASVAMWYPMWFNLLPAVALASLQSLLQVCCSD